MLLVAAYCGLMTDGFAGLMPGGACVGMGGGLIGRSYRLSTSAWRETQLCLESMEGEGGGAAVTGISSRSPSKGFKCLLAFVPFVTVVSALGNSLMVAE